MSSTRFEAFFLDTPSGQRFYTFYAPPAEMPLRGALLYLHPFAEELNRTRRMAALQARAFAAAGYAVLCPDLLGCGDSGGDFGDATWDAWLTDIDGACQVVRERVGNAVPFWLWGLRGGALLAAAAAQRADTPPLAGVLLWQPVVDGARHLDQFLRLKLTGDMLRGEVVEGVAALRARLAAGEAVEVAGYALNPALVAGISQARLDLAGLGALAPGLRVICLEVSSRAAAAPEALAAPPLSLSPAVQACLARGREAGLAVVASVAAGPAFWQTVNVVEAPELIAASLAAFCGGDT